MEVDSHVTYINDIRDSADFRTSTFSNFKKSEVKRELLNCIIAGKAEHACYWSAELVCSAHYSDLWEVILIYLGKNIHIGNPKLPIYLEMRFHCYNSIINNGMYTNELQTRNSGTLRKLFAEIVCILCFSNKKHAFDYIKFNREEEFSIERIAEKLRAPNTEYITDIFRRKDPKECFAQINEFAYSIEIHDTVCACYWLEWIIEFDCDCKKKKEPLSIERRVHIPVPYKSQEDVIWIVWDVLQYAIERKEDLSESMRELLSKIMGALLQLFCIHYTPGCAKRRRHLLYYAVELLTETVDFTNLEMISNKTMVKRVVDNIDNVYAIIKKNEVSPGTDYLFANLEKQQNIERSMRRMEMLAGADLGGSGDLFL